MGGHAFPDTVRLTAAEHARVKRMVLEALADDTIAPMLTVIASAEVLDKASFGDVDLYAAPAAECDAVQVCHNMSRVVVQALHCPVPPKRNGNTLSFLTAERYQVDIGFTDADKIALYATVHSNGDFALLLQISLSAIGLRLTTEGFFLRNDRLLGQPAVSKSDVSFLLSLDPAKVGEFLGLRSDAFDGQTSLSMEEIFQLVVNNRFFDGVAMATWMDYANAEVAPVQRGKRKSKKRAQERPMLKEWREWWRATGMTTYGDRRPATQRGRDEGVWEEAVEFFDKRAEFREWDANVRNKVAVAERAKECKAALNFALAKGWLPELTSLEIGTVLRSIRAEHGQLGSEELHTWMRALPPDALRSAVLAAAKDLNLPSSTL